MHKSKCIKRIKPLGAHLVQCDYGPIVEICCAQLEPIECMFLRFIAAQLLLHTFFGISIRFLMYNSPLCVLSVFVRKRFITTEERQQKRQREKEKKKTKRIYNNKFIYRYSSIPFDGNCVRAGCKL